MFHFLDVDSKQAQVLIGLVKILPKVLVLPAEYGISGEHITGDFSFDKTRIHQQRDEFKESGIIAANLLSLLCNFRIILGNQVSDFLEIQVIPEILFKCQEKLDSFLSALSNVLNGPLMKVSKSTKPPMSVATSLSVFRSMITVLAANGS